MICTHPLHMYYRCLDDGSEDHIFVNDNSLATFLDARTGIVYDKRRDVPCGQCIACRLNRSSEWALRCVLEASLYPIGSCKFVTLTYNPENLPTNYDLQMETYGTLVTDEVPTLCKSDPQNFIKRLRSKLKYHFNHDGLRVYYCGEYGTNNGRPHYHMILFNLPDGINYTPFPGVPASSLNHALYNCDLFDDCWGKGFVVVGNVTYDSCAYVARYIMKKQLGDGAEIYFKKVIVPEFTCMSRRPGIAKGYYDKEEARFYRFDRITITGKDGKPLVAKPPRYFDKLFAFDDPIFMESIKEERALSAENNLRQRRALTDLNDDEYLLMIDDNIKARIRGLIRPLD